jgi:hypothetical protein
MNSFLISREILGLFARRMTKLLEYNVTCHGCTVTFEAWNFHGERAKLNANELNWILVDEPFLFEVNFDEDFFIKGGDPKDLFVIIRTPRVQYLVKKKTIEDLICTPITELKNSEKDIIILSHKDEGETTQLDEDLEKAVVFKN